MTYREIEAEILQKYFQLLLTIDPLLRQIAGVKTLHAGGFRYQNQEKELVTPLHRLSFAMEIPFDTIVGFDLELFSNRIYDLSQQRIEQLHKMMFETLEQVTDLTGNQVDARGKTASPDLVLDMLEKVQLTFNKEGEPILPTLVVAPETGRQLSRMKFTKEQEERQRQILEKKKKEYHAKKRNRRLSYIN